MTVLGIREETVVTTRGKGKDAPTADIGAIDGPTQGLLVALRFRWQIQSVPVAQPAHLVIYPGCGSRRFGVFPRVKGGGPKGHGVSHLAEIMVFSAIEQGL